MFETHAIPPTFKASTARKIAQGLGNLALTIWAVRDIRRRDTAEIKGNRKVWLIAAFASPIGPIAYFLLGRRRGTQPAEIPLAVTDQS